jgi:nucleotide-binding universal stress UspA family protein
MKILLAYDGTANAKRALARAIELSKDSDGQLTIVYYVDLEAFDTFAAKHLLSELRDKMLDDAEKLVADAAVAAKRDGVSNTRTMVLRDGDPANAILSTAIEESPELIVVGRRGARALERFLLGSVSSRIVAHAKSDVLVVK